MNVLKQKAISGAKWTAIYTIIQAVINPFVLIVMARYLSPFEFGQIAVLTIIKGFSLNLARMGFSKAIIQKEEIAEGDLSSIFWFEQGIGVILFFSIYVLAGPISAYFELPESIGIIRFLSLLFLLEPIDLVFRSILEKELQFSLLNIAKIFRVIAGQLATVILLVLGFGVYSYVWGLLLGIVTMTSIMGYIFKQNRWWFPRLFFSFQNLRPYLSFGIYVAAKSFVDNLFLYVDEIIVGGLMGADILGIYHFAKKLITYLMNIIKKPVVRISFPILAKIRSDREQFNRAYIQIVRLLAFGSLPAFLGLAMTSRLFVPLFFGEQWISAVPLISILAFWGMFKILYAGVVSGAMYSLGKSDWIFYAVLVDLPFRTLFFYLLIGYGIQYISAFLVLIAFTKFIAYNFLLQRLSGLDLKHFLSKISVLLVSTALMGIVLYITETVLGHHIPDYLLFVFQVSTGFLIYVLSTYVVNRGFYYYVLDLGKKTLSLGA